MNVISPSNRPGAAYSCSKRFNEICVAHRNWRAKSHCRFVHGYARDVEITFGCDHLDESNFVVDFGGLKHVRAWLQDAWDHRTLIADDDPLLDQLSQLEQAGGIRLHVMDTSRGWGPSIEESCNFVFDHVDAMVREATNGRAWVLRVDIWEKSDNKASYHPATAA